MLAIIGLTAANAVAGTRPPAAEHFEAMPTSPVTSSGTYRITGGTGRYRHVRGHGDYRLTAHAIVAKALGKCGTNVVPYAQEDSIFRTQIVRTCL